MKMASNLGGFYRKQVTTGSIRADKCNLSINRLAEKSEVEDNQTSDEIRLSSLVRHRTDSDFRTLFRRTFFQVGLNCIFFRECIKLFQK